MKLALIIGGSSGIGQKCAEKLSEEFKVVNMSRSKAKGIDSISADVTDFNTIDTAFEILKRKYGVPEIMIYCAGFVEPNEILELSNEAWEKTIKTNLTGAFYCTKKFIEVNKGLGGKIIYTSSTAGMRAQPNWCAYASSKAGLINFSLTMAEELKKYNIKVYCIAPGRCATPLRKILAPDEDPGTIMQPEDVAQFVEYLIKNDELIDSQVIVLKKPVEKKE